MNYTTGTGILSLEDLKKLPPSRPLYEPPCRYCREEISEAEEALNEPGGILADDLWKELGLDPNDLTQPSPLKQVETITTSGTSDADMARAGYVSNNRIRHYAFSDSPEEIIYSGLDLTAVEVGGIPLIEVNKE